MLAPSCKCGPCLNLFGAPTRVAIAHVGGRLDRGDELENNVANANDDDDAAGNVIDGPAFQAQATDQDVDYVSLLATQMHRGFLSTYKFRDPRS